MKRKLKQFFSALLLAGFTLAVAGILAFYVLIVAGASPGLQTVWICSAMRTLSHKYLATAFFTDEYIAQVMAANEIDDSGHDSHLLAADGFFRWEETKKADYAAEGYEKLEDGIFLKEVSGLSWRGSVMLVEDPTRVKLTDTSQQFLCGETVMQMTESAGAVAGINGGGFQDGANYDSNGGLPSGLLIENGTLVYPEAVDDTVYNMIGLNENGVLILRHCTAQWALENGIVSAVSFAPFLVVNGEGLVKDGTGGWGIAPRTAIGQRETGEILFLVIDGRQPEWSIGCDLDVLQNVMLAEGVCNAAMLDGGSSTVMVYGGEYVNRPSLGHERWINNCFVVMPEKEK